MPIYNFKSIKPSVKSAHQSVEINDRYAGDVWREQVRVTISKLAGPHKTALRWRWFAQREGDLSVIGKNSRAALLLGAGFKSKIDAAEQLYVGRETTFS